MSDQVDTTEQKDNTLNRAVEGEEELHNYQVGENLEEDDDDDDTDTAMTAVHSREWCEGHDDLLQKNNAKYRAVKLLRRLRTEICGLAVTMSLCHSLINPFSA